MTILRQFLCFLRGHKRTWRERNGIMYPYCKCCKQDLDLRGDMNLFGW